MKFKDIPLSNVDLMNWREYLGIPLKGIFSCSEAKPLQHSPGSLGTQWVCCWKGKDMEYFDSFGLPTPDEWKQEMRKLGHKTFLWNDNQIQWIGSVRFLLAGSEV